MEVATGAMGSLLAKLGELLKDEYKLQKGVREDVEYLKRELESMHAALRKVGEVPPEQLDGQVKVWARELRELSYDMEDEVDTFLVRVDQDSSKGLIKKWRTRRQIANKIQDIKVRVQEVADRRNRNKVDDVAANPAAATTVDPRLSAQYQKVTDLVGTDEARDELIKRLTEHDDASKQQLKIVSVVGFGGMGKTTIANQVYQKLKMQFDCGAFVSISRSPNTKKVFRDILVDLDKEKYENTNFALWDERQLIDELRKSLEHKRSIYGVDVARGEHGSSTSWRLVAMAPKFDGMIVGACIHLRHFSVIGLVPHPCEKVESRRGKATVKRRVLPMRQWRS